MHEPHVVRDGQPPHFDPAQEDEAGWLGGTLLVTEESCLAACRSNVALAEAAARMGVSEDLMRWRINATGAQSGLRVRAACRIAHRSKRR